MVWVNAYNKQKILFCIDLNIFRFFVRKPFVQKREKEGRAYEQFPPRENDTGAAEAESDRAVGA